LSIQKDGSLPAGFKIPFWVKGTVADRIVCRNLRGVPLLFLSLDNTLLDRSGAFRAWGKGFLAEIGVSGYELDWLDSVDADGLTSAWDLADAIRARYRLRRRPIDLVEDIREGLLSQLRLDPLVAFALRIATDAGWTPVVVTNGETQVQTEKLVRTGLVNQIAAFVISEDVGVRKPNPRIFAIAAEKVGQRLAGAWLIGDSPEVDIGGANALGVPSAWIRRGRTWPDERFAPTMTCDGVIEAVAAVLATKTG
jgi:putative hydrolase of the HAD superfamily